MSRSRRRAWLVAGWLSAAVKLTRWSMLAYFLPGYFATNPETYFLFLE